MEDVKDTKEWLACIDVHIETAADGSRGGFMEKNAEYRVFADFVNETLQNTDLNDTQKLERITGLTRLLKSNNANTGKIVIGAEWLKWLSYGEIEIIVRALQHRANYFGKLIDSPKKSRLSVKSLITKYREANDVLDKIGKEYPELVNGSEASE